MSRERITGWIVVLSGLVSILYFGRSSSYDSTGPSTLAMISSYWTRPSQHLNLKDPSRVISPRDPIFYLEDDGSLQFAGYVVGISSESANSNDVIACWTLPSVAPDRLTWTMFRNQGSFAEAMRLLLPSDKRQRIEQKIREALKEHGDELVDQLLPLLESSLKESLPIIESGVRRSLAKHRTELDQLGDRWNESVVRQRLVPLTTQRMLPIVRKHGEPVAREVGEELWQRASVWRFGWRMVYDKSPLPQKDLTEQEWERFVNEEAIPVFESHAEQIARSVSRSIAEIANDPEVRRQLSEAVDVIANDPESQRLLRVILQESIAGNQELHRVWQDTWTSPEAVRALELASKRIEPVVREIGNELLGTPEEGIEPGFARLLRNQILRKDQRWLVVSNAEATDRRIQISNDSMPFPLPAFTGNDLNEMHTSGRAER